MKKLIIPALTHLFVLVFGFALGIYLLPILTAPKAPDKNFIINESNKAVYKTEFIRELDGSDLLHYGDGEVFLEKDKISFVGKLAPGPDYRLYLTKSFVQNEKEFLKIKMDSLYVGDVKTFTNFTVSSKVSLPLENYNSLIVWCESFNEFITSAKYK